MKRWLKSVVSYESRQALRFDALRFRARLRNGWRRDLNSGLDQLHLGSGSRRVPGWLNVDVQDSDLDLDLSARLPWKNGQFKTVVSQHVIEHLELHRELIPLLREVRRVCQSGAELWLSTPDLAQVCRSYEATRGADLLADRLRRQPGWKKVLGEAPPSQMINYLFHQMGQHKNLLDFELLSWALTQAGLVDCQRTDETSLLQRFPEFPARNDDWQSLYVKAQVP